MDRITVTAWAASREIGVATLQALGIADVDANGDLYPLVQAHIHPFRKSEEISIRKATGNMVDDGEGNMIPETVAVPGWHVNICYYGMTALNLLAEPPAEGWTEADGIFERTTILDMIDQRTGQSPEWYALEDVPLPPGYQMAGGMVRLYDPALISSQSCVFG